jgi:hypothetical protein
MKTKQIELQCHLLYDPALDPDPPSDESHAYQIAQMANTTIISIGERSYGIGANLSSKDAQILAVNPDYEVTIKWAHNNQYNEITSCLGRLVVELAAFRDHTNNEYTSE